jgi:hypothetical protein
VKYVEERIKKVVKEVKRMDRIKINSNINKKKKMMRKMKKKM